MDDLDSFHFRSIEDVHNKDKLDKLIKSPRSSKKKCSYCSKLVDSQILKEHMKLCNGVNPSRPFTPQQSVDQRIYSNNKNRIDFTSSSVKESDAPRSPSDKFHFKRSFASRSERNRSSTKSP